MPLVTADMARLLPLRSVTVRIASRFPDPTTTRCVLLPATGNTNDGMPGPDPPPKSCRQAAAVAGLAAGEDEKSQLPSPACASQTFTTATFTFD